MLPRRVLLSLGAGAPFVLGDAPQNFVLMLPATGPGCLLADLAGRLLTHVRSPHSPLSNDMIVYPLGYTKPLLPHLEVFVDDLAGKEGVDVLGQGTWEEAFSGRG